MNKQELEKQITQLKRKLVNIKAKIKSGNTKDIRAEWLRISKELAATQKTLALFIEEEKVVRYYPKVKIGLIDSISSDLLVWEPAPYIEGPVIFQTSEGIILVFDVVCLKGNGSWDDFLNHKLLTNRLMALVEVKGCLLSKFGFPGVEEIDANSLSEKGLIGYGVFEVINSLWEKMLQEKRLITWWHKVKLSSNSNTKYQSKRHFIISFKEGCFECLADELDVTLTEETDEKIRQFIIKQMPIPLIMHETEIIELMHSNEDHNILLD